MTRTPKLRRGRGDILRADSRLTSSLLSNRTCLLKKPEPHLASPGNCEATRDGRFADGKTPASLLAGESCPWLESGRWLVVGGAAWDPISASASNSAPHLQTMPRPGRLRRQGFIELVVREANDEHTHGPVSFLVHGDASSRRFFGESYLFGESYQAAAFSQRPHSPPCKHEGVSLRTRSLTVWDRLSSTGCGCGVDRGQPEASLIALWVRMSEVSTDPERVVELPPIAVGGMVLRRRGGHARVKSKGCKLVAILEERS